MNLNQEGNRLQLTTPMPRDQDSVFPGENLFLYWRTSASLWEHKLRDFPARGKILIPLYWAFHTETGEQFDFGSTRPETDLKRLVEIGQSLGREMIFLLPIGPMPMMACGGIPNLLARSPMIDQFGRRVVAADSEDSLIHFHSFFDPRIFQAFSRFLSHLDRYLSESGIGIDIWGVEPGYFERGFFVPTIRDYSQVFQHAFGRFLKSKKEEDAELTLRNQDEEEIYRREFELTIQELYLEEAKNKLEVYWEGTRRLFFLGLGQESLIQNVTGQLSQRGLLEESLFSMTRDVVPFSTLLNKNNKGELLRNLFDNVLSPFHHQSKFEKDFYEDSSGVSFQKLGFFDLYLSPELSGESDQLGLFQFLNQQFDQCYRVCPLTEFRFVEEFPHHEKVFFLIGEGFESHLFHQALKTFMAGGKLVIDRDSLNQEQRRKLETFLIENNLKVEQVFFHSNIQHVKCGEGVLVFVESEQLLKIDSKKQEVFWMKLLKTFEIRHLSIPKMEGLSSFWLTKTSIGGDLSYEEIRRVILMNPTSYRLKLSLPINRPFALLKLLNEKHCQSDKRGHELELIFDPKGCVSIDIGIFS